MSDQGQQHPISIYFWIWGLLFVLSAASYMVDYMQFQGYLRWSLIIIFMMLKAGLIVAIFMHMMWERMALILRHSGAAPGDHRAGRPDGGRGGLHLPHPPGVLHRLGV